MSGEPVLSLRHATFGYAERAVAVDVSFDLHQGERVAVVGHNGSGKSTLVKGILGLNDHMAGSVDVLGEPLDRLHRRHLLGYVPQRHTISGAAAATVEEIVTSGRLPLHPWYGRLGRADREAVAHAIDLVGLTEMTRAEGSTLSGGQQRRVLIARALAAQPRMLIMDEPTAGVDAANQASLVAVLSRLADIGTTLLIVTHEITPMRDLLTRYITMSGGRLAADETVPSGATGGAGSDDHAHHSDDDTGAPAQRDRLGLAPWSGSARDASTHPGGVR